MNGAQDLGGAMGFGAVAPEPAEPVFHAPWEARVLALTLAAGVCGRWTADASRFARESLHPAQYLTSSYYEIWLAALEKLAASTGMVEAAEIAGARAQGAPQARMLRGSDVDRVLDAGFPSSRPAADPPRFAVGETVVVKNMHPYGHTRLPGYARGRRGVVEAIRGCFVFPDTNASGAGENPQWCYAVRFTQQELWGVPAEGSVNIDAFEPYLEPMRQP